MHLHQSFEELVTHLESGPAKLVPLLERLLRFCREHSDELDRAERGSSELVALGHRTLSWFIARLQHADARFTSAFDISVMRGLGQQARILVADSAHASQDSARILVIRRLAEAIDETHGHRIAAAWTVVGNKDLRPGDLVPIFSPFGSKMFCESYGRSPGTPTFKLRRDGDATRRAVLVPKALPHSIRLVTSRGWTGLDAIEASTRIACAVPSGADVLAPPKINEETKRYFGVSPRDPSRQRDVALQLVQKADASGAGIVVLPEVCLDAAGIRDVAEWAQISARSIFMAICGTHHTVADGSQRNVAFVASRFSPALQQSKVIGMEWKPPGASHSLREDVENIDTPVVLITAQSWSAIILICRDFIDVSLSRLAADLRISLILVPACSPRTTDFRATAESLASTAQAHVIVANMCDIGSDKPDVAIAARPVTSGNDYANYAERHNHQLPCVLYCSLNSGPWALDEY